ncbi:MAG TPA: aconitate hydratase AcnA [Solirubrobacteraceae bacterium]|nr:aconitate hydratase AcnA [Solirubrobacteraceae bacterium]
MTQDSFGAKGALRVGGREYEIFRLAALQDGYDVARLPFSLKVLLENLLRHEGAGTVAADDVRALASWDATAPPRREIAFAPARVLMQDLTGVPAVVDLAAMRDAIAQMGGDPERINPLAPAELVIDHSVQVDAFGTRAAFQINADLEFERNGERYEFLRWGQQAFAHFAVVPPDTGIVHQVNLEYLARVVFHDEESGRAFPDTLVGTDSHTPMVNGLGVLGWGVGGIEAEAAMLGQPLSMLIPQVVGMRLHGALPKGSTATDLVLTVAELLRRHGVVGKFVEFYGAGVGALPIADRATIGNMSPEFGSTCAIFPIDAETLSYMRLSGRPEEQVELVEAYAREQGMWHEADGPEPVFSETLELDLASVEPSIAGPRRPQDRVPLASSREAFHRALPDYTAGRNGSRGELELTVDGEQFALKDGDVVIAAITSCTNTSNPSVMVGAGLLARNAVERGLTRRPWVKTSLAPGSKVVTEYLEKAGLTEPLDELGFNLVGYGCTTCIGNSGPLPAEISRAATDEQLALAAVLSGNRNFEGRINPDVKMSYLASPPLCVAYAIAGTMDFDFDSQPLGTGRDGEDVYLRDIWPSPQEVARTVGDVVRADMFRESYGEVFTGDERWQSMDVPAGHRFAWGETSTYVRRPPFLEGLPVEPAPVSDIAGARVLALLGDSVTTDHISPAGSIRRDGPAAEYLMAHGVEPRDFNSYGARRGNHEVMIRGTFANIRLRNLIGGGEQLREGGYTRFFGDGDAEQTTIYDAAMRYADAGVPLVVIAGAEYGSGSSRDWAAKGPRLLGVRAVIAVSYERIHRSNLVGMGILPLQFADGENAESLGLTGEEVVSVAGVAEAMAGGGAPPERVRVLARRPDGGDVEFTTVVRVDTPREAEYLRHGGILPYVLRNLLAR